MAREVSLHIAPGLVSQMNVVYFPQVGYLISMPHDPDLSPDELALRISTQEDPFEPLFSTEHTNFFKNTRMRELDTEFGDIHADIVDIEINYVQSLVDLIQANAESLTAINALIAKLDW